MTELDKFLGWAQSMRKSGTMYIFDDEGQIDLYSDEYLVIIGNTQKTFTSIVDATHYLWQNHSSYNVLAE